MEHAVSTDLITDTLAETYKRVKRDFHKTDGKNTKKKQEYNIPMIILRKEERHIFQSNKKRMHLLWALLIKI